MNRAMTKEKRKGGHTHAHSLGTRMKGSDNEKKKQQEQVWREEPLTEVRVVAESI